MNANYTITEFFIENRIQANSLGSRSMTRQNLPKLLRESKQLSKLLKNLSSEILQFLYDQGVWNLWLQLYHQRILEKEPNDELRQNFIHDEMQLHTSTHSKLNLIKSDIYIYIYNLFYILYLNHILLQFKIND
jgi:hypothetical protein